MQSDDPTVVEYTIAECAKDERCVYALLEIQRSLSEKASRSTHLWLQSLIAKIQRSNRRGRFALLIGNDRVDSAHSWRSSAMHHADRTCDHSVSFRTMDLSAPAAARSLERE